MKILQIIGSLGMGGAERVVINNNKMFKKFGHESFVVTLKCINVFGFKDDNFVCLNMSKRRKKTYLTLKKMINDINPDIILLHMQDMGRIFRKDYDKRMFNVVHLDIYDIVKQHSFYKKFKVLRDFKRIYNNSKVITVSDGIKENFLKFGFDMKYVTTIYNPFNEKEILEKSDEFDVDYDNYIVHVASLGKKVKRQDILLKAYKLADLKEDLLIIGDGCERENLEKLAESLGIKDKVKFLGLQQNPYPYMKKAKLFILSSEAEGLPTVLIESLILKTPIVSTDCNSGPSEILTDELSEYLAEVNNPQDLADKIKLALRYYPKITRKHYEKFLDENIIKRYLELKEIVNNE